MSSSKVKANDFKVVKRERPLIRRVSVDDDGLALKRSEASQGPESYYMASKVRKFVSKEVWLENSINTIVDDLLSSDDQRKFSDLPDKFEPVTNSLNIAKKAPLFSRTGKAVPILVKATQPSIMCRAVSECSFKNSSLEDQKLCKLICSKSLDCDIKQKLKGCQLRREVCVTPFKNIFTKKSAVSAEFNGNSKMSKKSCDKLPNVENSGFHFNEKEMTVIDKTRNELREQISLIRSKKEDESRKIQLNIFLKPHNDSFDAHESTEDVDERTNELLESVCDVLVEGRPSIISRRMDDITFTQPQTGEVYKASEVLSVDQHKDVQTLMSLRCSSPDLSVEHRGQISNNLVYRNVKPTNKQGENRISDKEPVTSNMKFLKTLIKESKYYVSPTKSSAKEFKPAPFRIETEVMSPNLSGNESNVSAITIQRNHSSKLKMSNPTTPKKNNILEQNLVNNKADLNVSSEVAIFSNYLDDQVTQTFRKKLEESKELHRRLHFCGVNVSKGTIIRALLSPAQIKMYENLDQSI